MDERIKKELVDNGFKEEIFFRKTYYVREKNDNTPCEIICTKLNGSWILRDEGFWVDRLDFFQIEVIKEKLKKSYYGINGIIIKNGYVEKQIKNANEIKDELELFIRAIKELRLY